MASHLVSSSFVERLGSVIQTSALLKTFRSHRFINQPVMSSRSSTVINIHESVTNQTDVSFTFANHLLSKKFPKSNIFFSPLSIHIVLGVIAAGSNGQTLDQLLSFLKTKTIHDLNSLYSQLAPLVFADGRSSGGPRLSFAHGLWLDQTLSLKPSFKQVADAVYNTASSQVDFETKTKAAVVKEVNWWAEKHTGGIIKEVLSDDDAVDADAQLIFANAVYFKGNWNTKFDPSKTKFSDFHLLDGSKVQVPFMNRMQKKFVRCYDGFKVLGLPYFENDDDLCSFTMYFFLPDTKDGLPSLLEKIGSESKFLDSHISHEVPVGQISIPKFRISFGFKACDMLKELGLVQPFNGVGLTEMVDCESLYAESIHHKSFVEVNEKGTEAVAASVISASKSAWRPMIDRDEIVFVADHPFLFVIKEDTTEAVLFIGQVIDPSVT